MRANAKEREERSALACDIARFALRQKRYAGLLNRDAEEIRAWTLRNQERILRYWPEDLREFSELNNKAEYRTILEDIARFEKIIGLRRQIYEQLRQGKERM